MRRGYPFVGKPFAAFRRVIIGGGIGKQIIPGHDSVYLPVYTVNPFIVTIPYARLFVK